MLLAESLRPMPFCPQNPIHAPVKSIGQQNQHLWTGIRFPSLNLREMPRDNVEVRTQFLLQNLPPDFPNAVREAMGISAAGNRFY
jgi:hypothetical protein